MASVNNTNPNLDLNVRIFDQFYKYDFSVPASEYDQIYSFLQVNLKVIRQLDILLPHYFKLV